MSMTPNMTQGASCAKMLHVQPIIAGCNMQTGKVYMDCYNQVAKPMYRYICDKYRLVVAWSK